MADEPFDLQSLSPRQQREVRVLLEKHAAVTNFAWFCRLAWGILNPGTPLVWNWHHEEICNAVQKQIEGDPEYQRLLICVPPGSMKSTLISVMRPAWMWLRYPHRRSLYISSNEGLVTQFSRWTRDIVLDPEYQKLIPACVQVYKFYKEPWTIEVDQNEKNNFENTAKGFRQCTTISSKFTGKRGDDIVLDDVLDAGEVIRGTPEQMASAVQQINTIIANQLQSRVNDLAKSTWTLIMQRLHEEDPAGIAIKEGGWKVLCYPQEFDPTHPLRDPTDPRTEAGEMLVKERDDAEAIARIKRKMDPQHYAAQYQQRPTAAEGGQIRKAWIDAAPTYRVDPLVRADDFDVIDLTVDCTFKGGARNDRVSIQAVGRRGQMATLLHDCTKTMTFTETIVAIREVAAMFPRYRKIVVEDKANGPAVVDLLKTELRAIVAVNPGTKSKAQRVNLGSVPRLQAGQVELPDESVAPWVKEWKAEHIAFSPAAAHDDRVDAFSQLMLEWAKEDIDPFWLDDTIRANLERVVDNDMHPLDVRTPPGGEIRLWTGLPRVHPREAYCMGLVTSWCRNANSAPAVGVVMSEDGYVVGTMVVSEGGTDSLVQAITEMAQMLSDHGPGPSIDAPTLRLRLADPPKERGMAARLAKALSSARKLVQIQVLPGSSGAMDDNAHWRDDESGRAMANLLDPVATALMMGGIEVPDPQIATALVAVTVNGDNGRPKMGLGAPDRRMINAGSEMDSRILALGMAEAARQTVIGRIRLVTGAVLTPKMLNGHVSNVERWTTASKNGKRTGHDAVISRMMNR